MGLGRSQSSEQPRHADHGGDCFDIAAMESLGDAQVLTIVADSGGMRQLSDPTDAKWALSDPILSRTTGARHRRTFSAVTAVLAAIAWMVVVPAPTAMAADQTVSSTADDGTAGTLRAAINDANATGGGTISIGVAGTIELTSNLPAITQPVTIVGLGAGDTVIDTNGFRFVFSTANAAITIQALTITGNTTASTGAILLHENGTTTLERVEVTGNVGALFGTMQQKQAGVFTVIDSTFHDNTGAILGNDHSGTPNTDSIASPQPDSIYANRMYISGTTFSDNGDCVLETARFVEISGSTFTGNSGSAACLDGLHRKRILNSTFTGNGTAVALTKNATWIVPVTMDSVTITGNTTGISGLYSQTVITNSTICDNTTNVAYRSDVNNPQDVTFIDTDVDGTCPPPVPPPTTTTTTTTTTTVPPSTIPPTTTSPPSPAPSPLAPPDLSPLVGASGCRTLREGTPATCTVTFGSGRASLAGRTTAVTIHGDAFLFGNSVVNFIPASRAVVEGSGYRPGTLVEVWLFSTPTRVAAVTVEADGTFTASALSPASLAPGAHTLVISGISADATPEATSLSVQVAEPDQPPTPASQVDPAPLSFTG